MVTQYLAAGFDLVLGPERFAGSGADKQFVGMGSLCTGRGKIGP